MAGDCRSHGGIRSGVVSTDAAKVRVLCVDDEPAILAGLARQLRQRFDVVTAVGGALGLEQLAAEAPFGIVISDMRMPGMDGATFLTEVRSKYPDTVRMLLTGQADLQSTIAAVNHGSIFRFLSKPCAQETLFTALDAAARQYQLVIGERVLLEQTLHGSIKALTDILALASPVAFGRATRLKTHVAALAARLEVQDRWPAEVAAMLSQVGCVTLPPTTADKLYHGQPLDEAEVKMVQRLPAIALELLAGIPRLEPVCAILEHYNKRFDGTESARTDPRGADLPWGARALRIVVAYDVLLTQDMAAAMRVGVLQSRTGSYDPALLAVFAELVGKPTDETELCELMLRDIRCGMRFAEDLLANNGMLLIARGQEVTKSLQERLANFAEKYGVREPVRMIGGGGDEKAA